jgi:TonB family protein
MNRISTRMATLLLTVILCGGTLQAQQPLQQRISVTYQGATSLSVFQAIADVLHVRLQLDGKVDGAVTLDVRNVSVETVLRAVCESIGCRWRVESGALVVERDANAPMSKDTDPLAGISVKDVFEEVPVDIRWNDAPFDAAVRVFARMLGAEPVIDGTLSAKRISLTLTKRSVNSALNAACEQAGCRWRLTESPSRVLRVIDAPPAKPQVAGGSAQSSAGLARIGDAGVTAPRLLSAAHPRYTDAARRAGIQGVVVVECVVGIDGTVGDARIVKSLDQAYGLDSEALAAARLYVFSPGTRGGKPIPVVITLDMSFTLR